MLYKNSLLLPVCFLIAAVTGAQPTNSPKQPMKSPKIPVIFDTDFGPDYDDVEYGREVSRRE
jgi:hypothetical protein